jgi:nucleoside-diphosphate-sugar epimerase
MQKIAISGIYGTLGSILHKELSKKSIHCIGVSNRAINKDRINIIDLDKFKFLAKNNAFSTFIHTSTCYGRNGESFDEVEKVNYYYSKELAEICKNNSIRFINCGTCSNSNVSHYSLTKNKFSHWLSTNMKNHNVCDLSIDIMVGFTKNSWNILQQMIISYKKGENFDVKTPKSVREITSYSDISKAIISIIMSKRSENYEKIHIGSGIFLSIADLQRFVTIIFDKNTHYKLANEYTSPSEYEKYHFEYIEGISKEIYSLLS